MEGKVDIFFLCGVCYVINRVFRFFEFYVSVVNILLLKLGWKCLL